MTSREAAIRAAVHKFDGFEVREDWDVAERIAATLEAAGYLDLLALVFDAAAVACRSRDPRRHLRGGRVSHWELSDADVRQCMNEARAEVGLPPLPSGPSPQVRCHHHCNEGRSVTRAPRIDTVRNSLTATRTLIGDVLPALEDLHFLAYDRGAAAERLKVRGGEPDYALDTHGDPRAREAYVALSEAALDACQQIAAATHDVIVLLNAGTAVDDTKGRGEPIDIEDLAVLLDHQARRAARGEYTPARTRPQPLGDDASRVLDRVRRERDEARQAAERYHRLLQTNGIDPDDTAERRRGWRSA